jgi:hypothetical protein
MPTQPSAAPEQAPGIDWTRTTTPAPEGCYVMTKIDDANGCRNEQVMRRQGRLWFCRDGCYVYYTPTHWRFRQ